MTKLKETKEILEEILNHNDLDEFTSRQLMRSWLNDEIIPAQTGALLAGLRAKGATGTELAAMSEELLKACSIPIIRPDLFLVDTCGTGGDGANTFNISTAVAFVASSCGVKVAKHGNRSASGKVGSADVLSNLGLNLNASLEKTVKAINELGITFLFAPAWHKSLAKLAPVRKSLGIRTVFNQLGPLVNPLRPNAQVLGVASEDLLEPMAEALNKLGMKRAIVIYGYGGLDEASLEGNNKVIFLDKGKLNKSIINISDYEYDNFRNDEIIVSEDESNEEILSSVLNGRGKEAQINVVALNSALVLWAAGLEDNIEKGIETSISSMREGLPWEKFSKLSNYLSSKN
tara:strand:+ start:1864 stop:2901 length:1038 start_codon:yes stop_codon:yes gene_type:complete